MIENKVLKILVVDDDRLIRTTLENLLRNAGHTVSIAKNGMEAMEFILSQDYDAVILDMNMPEMDGWTTAATIRNHGRTTPILAYSSYGLIGDQARALAAGCTHFLTKPADAGLLMEALTELMNPNRGESGSS